MYPRRVPVPRVAALCSDLPVCYLTTLYTFTRVPPPVKVDFNTTLKQSTN